VPLLLEFLEKRVALSSTDFFTTTFTAHSYPAADGAYHDVGSPLSFTGDRSPVQLSAAVQITNLSSVAPCLQVFVQLTVDGTAVGHGRYVTVAANGYAEANLEELDTGLAPGSHTVTVRTDDPVGEPAVRIDSGSTINAVQFRAVPGVGPTVDPFSSSFTANSFPAADGAYHDVGSPLTFTGDGSPVRLSAAVQITNLSSVAESGDVHVQLTVDGTMVGHVFLVTLAANGYAEANLEELDTGLAAGSHTVKVQIDDPVAEPAVRIDSGSTINAVQFRAIANVGPTVDFFSSTFTSNSFPTANGAYHDVGDPLSFTGDGSPVRLSAAVQLGDIAASEPSLQVFVQLTVDGTMVGHARYVTVPPNGYAEANLEELVTGLAAGSHTVRLQFDDIGRDVPAVGIGANSTINALQFRTITPTPTTTSTATPTPAPVHLTAILFTQKVGKKNVQFILVTSSAGGTPRQIRSPFQSTAYKGITVVAKDSNGDGSDDSIVVTGTKKRGRKTSSITILL
jgi:hypothetical protein